MSDISTKEVLYILREDFPDLREFDWAIPETWVREITQIVGVPFADLARGTVWGYFEDGSPFGAPIFRDPLPAAVFECYLDIMEGKLDE